MIESLTNASMNKNMEKKKMIEDKCNKKIEEKKNGTKRNFKKPRSK